MIDRNIRRPGLVLGAVILVVAVSLIGAGTAVAGEMSPTHAGPMSMDGGHMQGPSGPFFWWMPFVMPVIWLGVLTGVLYLFYRFITRVASTESAMEELDKAFARGEISNEEYERRRQRLKS